jgi:hypothetical protein
MDEDARERFYLTEQTKQMAKCRFIPKYCFRYSSGGTHAVAQLLKVDPHSVYVERMTMLITSLLDHSLRISDHSFSMDVLLVHMRDAMRAFGFGELPTSDFIWELTDLCGRPLHLTTLEMLTAVSSIKSTFLPSSVDGIRNRLKEFAKLLLNPDDTLFGMAVDQLREIIVDTALDTIAMDETDLDLDSWLLSETIQREQTQGRQDEYFHRYGVSVKQQLELELAANRERVQKWEDELDFISEFGIAMSFSAHAGLRSCVDRLIPNYGDDYSESALKFLQLVIEDLDKGLALETKVEYGGLMRDYGVLFGRHGTVWRRFLFSDEDSDPSVMDDDSEYVPSDAESEQSQSWFEENLESDYSDSSESIKGQEMLY